MLSGAARAAHRARAVVQFLLQSPLEATSRRLRFAVAAHQILELRGQYPAQPAEQLGFGRPAKTGKHLMGIQERVLHHVGRVGLARQSAIDLDLGEELEVAATGSQQLAQRLAIAGACQRQEILGLKRVVAGHRQTPYAPRRANRPARDAQCGKFFCGKSRDKLGYLHPGVTHSDQGDNQRRPQTVLPERLICASLPTRTSWPQRTSEKFPDCASLSPAPPRPDR